MLRGAGAAGPKCAFVCSFAVGYDTIDIDECTRRNIVVTSGAGSITETTADVALFLLMGCTRHMGDALFAAKSGDADELAPLWFNRSATATANDPGQGDAQVLGVIGFGRIGQALSRKCHLAFGMDVIFYDTAFIHHSEVVRSPRPHSTNSLRGSGQAAWRVGRRGRGGLRLADGSRCAGIGRRGAATPWRSYSPPPTSSPSTQPSTTIPTT